MVALCRHAAVLKNATEIRKQGFRFQIGTGLDPTVQDAKAGAAADCSSEPKRAQGVFAI